MQILQVCLKPPYPKVDGGCIAIAAMTESLLMAGHSVKVLSMATHKHPFNPSKIPSDVLNKTKMETVDIDTRIKPLEAFLNLFSSESYNIKRFYSKLFELQLTKVLEENDFDIIHLESIYCTPYIKTFHKYSKAKIVVRAHNIEFEIWKQLGIQEENPLKRWYFNLLSKRLKSYESDVLKKVDAIVAITSEDESEMRKLGVDVPIQTIPIGIDVDSIKTAPLKSAPLHLYHLGAMDWHPNIEGVIWFLNKVWPQVESTFPDVLCSLAGRKMPANLLSRSNEKLLIEEEIPSISAYTSDKNVAIIPLLSGSGMRVKIVEALALGKVVISTSLGATGIPFEDGKNILIANSPSEIIEKIGLLRDTPSLVSDIGNEARKLAKTEFDLKILSSKLTYFYANL